MTDATEKAYSKDGLTVLWRPSRCIHSAKCVGGLGAVFDPGRRPWIDVSAASADAIIAQVKQCPTGALGWRREPAAGANVPGGEAVPAPAPEVNSGAAAAPSAPPPAAAEAAVSLELVPNGPLIIRGEFSAGGELRTGPTAYCRCGASNRKPYCDGTHARIGFKS